jgi:hypothetical protein
LIDEVPKGVPGQIIISCLVALLVKSFDWFLDLTFPFPLAALLGAICVRLPGVAESLSLCLEESVIFGDVHLQEEEQGREG